MFKGLVKKGSFITTLVFLLSLISNVATAEINLNMYAMPFKDTPINHWGLKDIIKMNHRNVVTGYNDGNFYPGKPVTQIEALLMAVRNLGVKTQSSTIDINQALPVTVPNWVEKGYKKEVLYALEKGLIVPSENNFNATANATRAWVAQLIVRMINKSGEAAQLTNQNPSFTDASSIPAWAKGPVNTTIKYKLIAGYPDNTFKPSQNITRAEMVTLFSRSEQYLDLNETIINTKLVSLSGQNITISVNGTLKTITRSSDTWIFDAQGKATSATTLKENDPIKVILNGSTVKYIEILPAYTVLTNLKGTVLQVLAKEKVIVVKDETQKIHTKTLSPLATFSALNQLEAGTQVELGINAKDEIISVLLLNTKESTANTGIIYDLNPTQKLLILKDSSGKVNAYQYSDQVTVKIPDQRFASIKDLLVGDEVKLKLSAGVITEIELVKAKQQLTLTGKIALISPEKRILTLQKDDNSLEAFTISDNVEIKVSGLNYPQLSNILVNDRVELSIEQGKVSAITVKDRSVENITKGTVIAVDTNNKILTLKTEKDELKAIEVSSRAEFLIDDRTSSYLSDVKKDMKVELQLVDNKIIYLENTNTIASTVVSLDQNRRLITLKVNNSDPKTYVLASAVDIDIEGDSSPDLNDINKNDYVEVRLEENIVAKINVQKTYVYQISDVLKASKELKVKDKDGNSKYLYTTSRVELIVAGKTSPGIDDFAVGNTVKATFLGHKLTKVEVLPAVLGRVTLINTQTNTIIFMPFEGSSTTYNFNSKSEVLNGSQKNYQLNALATGDRVEVREKEDGGFSFNIMKKITGKFQGLSDDGKRIHLNKDPFSLYSYDLASNVYIHSGNQLIIARNLAKDTQIDVYLLDDIVYEVEKK